MIRRFCLMKSGYVCLLTSFIAAAEPRPGPAARSGDGHPGRDAHRRHLGVGAPRPGHRRPRQPDRKRRSVVRGFGSGRSDGDGPLRCDRSAGDDRCPYARLPGSEGRRLRHADPQGERGLPRGAGDGPRRTDARAGLHDDPRRRDGGRGLRRRRREAGDRPGLRGRAADVRVHAGDLVDRRLCPRRLLAGRTICPRARSSSTVPSRRARPRASSSRTAPTGSRST